MASINLQKIVFYSKSVFFLSYLKFLYKTMYNRVALE